MRNVRLFGHRRYTWHGSYWRKGEAKIEAEKLRKKGYQARVTGTPNYWQVYWRNPKGKY